MSTVGGRPPALARRGPGRLAPGPVSLARILVPGPLPLVLLSLAPGPFSLASCVWPLVPSLCAPEPSSLAPCPWPFVPGHEKGTCAQKGPGRQKQRQGIRDKWPGTRGQGQGDKARGQGQGAQALSSPRPFVTQGLFLGLCLFGRLALLGDPGFFEAQALFGRRFLLCAWGQKARDKGTGARCKGTWPGAKVQSQGCLWRRPVGPFGLLWIHIGGWMVHECAFLNTGRVKFW